jgi:hypothetical protein
MGFYEISEEALSIYYNENKSNCKNDALMIIY